MKTYPIIALLAAFVAFVFSPLSFELTISLLFTAGLGCVVLCDYTREAPRLRSRLAPEASLGRFNPRTAPAFELAA
jgi:hypothetical protein